MSHPSDSRAQRLAEQELIRQLSADLDVPLQPSRVELGSGVKVEVDGLNAERQILCEVYAHIGATRGAQSSKVAKDILKMLTIERRRGGEWTKILCFADADTARCVLGASWLTASCRDFGVKVRVISLPPDVRTTVVASQRQQVMVNPS